MPAMLKEFETSKTPVPPLGQSDVADLFAYFYATLYFSPHGDAARGASVFADKQCSSCHSEILGPQPRKSLLETWTDLRDPSTWAERMWNHATEMDSAMSNRGIRWPDLSDQEVADLVTFLSTVAGSRAESVSFSIGQPDMGQAAFERSCSDCHTMGRSEKSKVDLLSRRGPRSIAGYISAMWNHAPAMRKRGGATPKLRAGEMPDLVAYLFSQRYFFEPGDPGRGKRVFEEKECATCHDLKRFQTNAPDLSKSVESFSPVTLTAAAWRHGLPMLAEMKRQRISWPEFKGREMADLITYLNSKLIVRVAEPPQQLRGPLPVDR
jgi:cytochrome c2